MMFLPTATLTLIWRGIARLLRFNEQSVAFIPKTYEQQSIDSIPKIYEEQSVDFIPRTYEEDIRKRGVEPAARSLRLVYHSAHREWHVKVTFKGTLQAVQTSTFASKPERRTQLVNLCLCIDFDRLELLDDTVTELIITYQQGATTTTRSCQTIHFKSTPDIESEYASIANRLCVIIRKDPYRVRFPTFENTVDPIHTRDLSQITKTQEFSMGVCKACVNSDETTYVYKEVDRPLYEPRDTNVLEQELHNLKLLRGIEGVAQLVAAVVSGNPYQTIKTSKVDNQTVLRGILLEYHSNGTLEDVLRSQTKKRPWRQWALQLTDTLSKLHAYCNGNFGIITGQIFE
ncbi:hypothetical protein VC83_03529 [Pseudogymnoascus destructans]|uniref:Protein kinase domain-containing protein n=1 Tax=Pseudogymnoascus destructans TaxID=655981 RepID=A0A177ADY9_9PEZI|nr:uncharacterized protein VC83_03529 [Pseudogymnoascus destructans]OAF60325.1 hypothetical protein VC83_03529 [Pseudogymnoascus destructans]